ncbi:MAG TPA: hypothetical protein VF596_06970 [Pyrinomonadaceae bacterium]|jgi:hypothetical protein
MLRDSGKQCAALEMYKRSLAMLPINAPALKSAGAFIGKARRYECGAAISGNAQIN